MNVLGAHFEHVFEVGRNVRKLALQEIDDILVVFALLVSLWMLLFRELLKSTDLLVERRQVLLDDECELVDLYWPIVEQGPPFRNYYIYVSNSAGCSDWPL